MCYMRNVKDPQLSYAYPTLDFIKKSDVEKMLIEAKFHTILMKKSGKFLKDLEIKKKIG